MADRSSSNEIRLTRIYDAPVHAVWDAWTIPEQVAKWWGRRFVINRALDAPIARVFEMWANPEHLAKWLPPPGTTMRFLRSEIAAGKSTLFAIAGNHGTMHVQAEYLAIDPPRCIVYTQRFVDEREQLAPALGTETWPATLLTTVLFTKETPDRTRVTVTSEPYGEVGQVTGAEVEAFVRERAGMTLGWTSSCDALEAFVQ